MAMNRVCIVEHTGIHLDAPRHFDPAGATVANIPISDLLVPLVVIDIRQKFRTDRDVRVTQRDVDDWERHHGRMPAGACVAMLSGYDPIKTFSGNDSVPAAERRKSPGFDAEAMKALIRSDVRSIAVDAMSIDAGEAMPAFPVRQVWLRSGRWKASPILTGCR